MSSGEVATMLGVSQATLSRWRFEGSGPQYLKLGARRKSVVRYRREDVLAYLRECERRATAGHAGSE